MGIDFDPNAADSNSKYKVRIYGQAFVYQRRTIPKKEMQQTQFGPIEALNWYDELECQQLAVNVNTLYIDEKALDHLLDNLKQAIKKSMMDKGLVNL